MQLSQVVRGLPGTLVSDGGFSNIAFATEREETGLLTFLENEKFLSALDNPNISCVLIIPELAAYVPNHIRGVFICEKPKVTLFEIHNKLAHDSTYVGEDVPTKIGKDCNISPLSAIDKQNIVIGDRVTIEPFVVIKGRVSIGNDTIIRSGAIIGCKGFSFSKGREGENSSVIDTAKIVIGERVEIFEQVAISTGIFPWEKTVIGKMTKIDTKGFVAHGTHIGRNCLLAAGSRCCGNCHIGDDVWIGPGAIISNRVRVEDKARVSIGSVVIKDVSAGETVSGNFAIPHRRFIKNLKESIKE